MLPLPVQWYAAWRGVAGFNITTPLGLLSPLSDTPALCVSCEREARSSSSYCTIGSVPPPQMHTTAHARATGIQSFKLDGDPKKVAWSTQVFSLKSGKVSFVPFFSRFYFFSKAPRRRLRTYYQYSTRTLTTVHCSRRSLMCRRKNKDRNDSPR